MGRSNAEFRGKPTHMTAIEITDKYEPGDLTDWEANHDWDEPKPSEQEFWEGKYSSAQKKGLVKSILKKGVTEPITVSEKYGITDGHHRISVMLKHAPNQPIPVSHDD